MATYYVANAGNDSHDGLTPATAFLTLTHAFSTATTNDTILANGGDTFRETGTFSANGQTLGAYGTGIPIISGSDVLSSWTSEAFTAPVTDATQDTSNADRILGSTGYTIGQAYVPTVTGTLNAIKVKMATGGSPMSTTLRIGTSSDLTTYLEEITQTVTQSGDGFITFPSVVNPTLTNGVTYYFGYTTTAAAGQGAIWDGSTPYAAGYYYYASGVAWNLSSSVTTRNLTFEVVLNESGGTIYYATEATSPTQVLEDSTRLAVAASKAAMTVGSFWYDTPDTRLYIRTFEDASPSGHTIEAATRTRCLFLNGKTGCAISTVTAHGAAGPGLEVTGDYTGLAISAFVGEYCFNQGLYFSQYAATGNTITGVSVRNSEVRFNGGCGIDGSIANWTGWVIDSNYAHDNCMLTDLDGSTHQYSAGIKFYSTTRTGGAGAVLSNNRSLNNLPLGTAYDYQGTGIWLDTLTGVILQGNVCSGNGGPGVFIEITSGVIAKFNASYNNRLECYRCYSDAAAGLDTTGFYNNVGYGGTYGLHVSGDGYGGAGAGGAVNNTFQNNIMTGASISNLYADHGGDNVGARGSGNVYTYNCFGPEATNFIQWAAGTYFATYAAWQGASGAGAGVTDHYVNADPLFVSASTGNFHLSPGSPAIKAGVYVAGVNTANPPDMGIYESDQQSGTGTARRRRIAALLHAGVFDHHGG